MAVEREKVTYRLLENHIFELKVINYIQNIWPESQIVYEPQGINKDSKNCDLLVQKNNKYLIELKSFHPQHKPTPIPYDHITKGNEIIMDG